MDRRAGAIGQGVNAQTSTAGEVRIAARDRAAERPRAPQAHFFAHMLPYSRGADRPVRVAVAVVVNVTPRSSEVVGELIRLRWPPEDAPFDAGEAMKLMGTTSRSSTPKST